MWNKAPHKLGTWLNELKKIKEDQIGKSGLCNRTFPGAKHCITIFTVRLGK